MRRLRSDERAYIRQRVILTTMACVSGGGSDAEAAPRNFGMIYMKLKGCFADGEEGSFSYTEPPQRHKIHQVSLLDHHQPAKFVNINTFEGRFFTQPIIWYTLRMLLPTALVAALGLAASTQALNIPRGTFKEYTSNGFPNRTTMQQELMIAEQAGGKLPGGNLPTNLSDASITAWQLIAFNELFEVAYFSAVLKNVTEGKKGYNLTRSEREIAVKVLEAVRAVSETQAVTT